MSKKEQKNYDKRSYIRYDMKKEMLQNVTLGSAFGTLLDKTYWLWYGTGIERKRWIGMFEAEEATIS